MAAAASQPQASSSASEVEVSTSAGSTAAALVAEAATAAQLQGTLGLEPAVEDAPPSKRRKVEGVDRHDGFMYECSRYVWRDKRSVCSTEPDKKFSSKRMALLYIARMNSDSLQIWLRESRRSWEDVCSATGVHAIVPNEPFDMDRFIELSEEVLEQYGKAVGNMLNVKKAPQGEIYRFHAVGLATTNLNELCQILLE